MRTEFGAWTAWCTLPRRRRRRHEPTTSARQGAHPRCGFARVATSLEDANACRSRWGNHGPAL